MIRLLTRDDLDEYLALRFLSMDNTETLDTLSVIRSDFLSKVSEERKPNPLTVANKTYLYGVLRAPDKLIGTVEVNEENLALDGRKLTFWMYDAHRGQGLMKAAILEVMREHGQQHSFNHTYYADVPQDNAAALWLLWSLKFTEVERWQVSLGSPVFVRLIDSEATRRLAT